VCCPQESVWVARAVATGCQNCPSTMLLEVLSCPLPPVQRVLAVDGKFVAGSHFFFFLIFSLLA